MRIDIRFVNDNKRTYGKSIKFEKEIINDNENNHIIPKMLYMLLQSLGRTMQKKCGIPFFVNLDIDMSGNVTGCHFEVNKKRYKELKKLYDEPISK